MKKHPVVICSNLVNRYGFRVLASGIKLDAYTKNPIVLYAHQRPSASNPKLMPIGKMLDIRLDAEGQLVGNMTFDQKDEFALSVESKWEDGYLNAVSLKAEILTLSEAPEHLLGNQAYPTIIESLLEEVSVEPVPGDSNAVSLRLHYKGKPAQTISLGDDSDFDPSKLFPTKTKKSDMKLIQLAFTGQKFVILGKDATEEQIATAVSELAAKANESAENVVTLSAQVTEKDTKIADLQKQIQTVELQAVTDKANALVDEAVAAKKITPGEKPEYVALAKTNFDTVKKILDNKKGFSSLAVTTEAAAGGVDYASLSYDELDKGNHIAKLKKDQPELYKEKFKSKYGRDPK